MATADDGLVLDDVDPAAVRRIHLVGVAGTGMGAFAGMLKTAGHEVTGSDQNVYPPMSDMLRAWAIPVLTPYSPGNLDVVKPDLVVIGNVIRRVNPEAAEVRARRLPQMSFPAALGAFFLRRRHAVVVTGTHGKTTTTALLGHVLADPVPVELLGLQPGPLGLVLGGVGHSSVRSPASRQANGKAKVAITTLARSHGMNTMAPQ